MWTPEMTRLRGAGRALAVTSGALVACLIVRVDPPSAVLALTVSGALIGLAATRPSRWYVTGGFTTFLVISLLLYGNPELAQSRFNERVLETLVGVAVAFDLRRRDTGSAHQGETVGPVDAPVGEPRRPDRARTVLPPRFRR